MKAEDREGWLAQMNAPLERPAIYGKPKSLPKRPTPAELQADTDAFLAAQAALGSGG